MFSPGAAMPAVEERIEELHQAIGRGRPYANALLDAKRLLSDATPDYEHAYQQVEGVRKMYDMKNRRTLREAPAENTKRRSIEEQLTAFEQILKILQRKAEEQARKPKPTSTPTEAPIAKTAPAAASAPKTQRATSVEVENILSALQAVNEAVISLRLVILQKPVGESGAHRSKVAAIINAFQNDRPDDAREMAAKILRGLDQNFKLWQREAAALKARMESGKEDFPLPEKNKFRQELVIVPNQFGIADRQIRRLINGLDILLKKDEGQQLP
jgi:hypothetical protein